MEHNPPILEEILETVRFIKDHAASQESVDNLEKRVTKMEALMVTKDYLDDKLADLRGDLVVLMRKEDSKLKALVKLLLTKKIILETEADQIYKLEPFAQIM